MAIQITSNFNSTTLYGNDGIWEQEKQLVHVTGANAGALVKALFLLDGVEPQNVPYYAVYADANGEVTLDVTDALRAYKTKYSHISAIDAFLEIVRVEVYADASGSGSAQEVSTPSGYTRGLINPQNLPMPDPCKIGVLEGRSRAYNVWTPSLIIAGGLLARVQWEMWGDGFNYDDGQDQCYYDFGNYNLTPSPVIQLTVATKTYEVPYATENAMIADANPFYITTYFHNIEMGSYHINMQPQCDDKEYAAVEWESITGQTRRHIFEVVKQTAAAEDVISLETIANDWNERKGRLESCTLRLEGLERYDMWYYGDVITSSKVRVTFDGQKWYNVQVKTKNFTLPNSNIGKLGTLEIDINFARYDTI